MQPWRSHSNAICNHSFKKRIELRTQEQPLVAEHRGGTNRVRNDRSHNRRTHEVPFIAGCSHFTRKKTRFRSPDSSPKTKPVQQSCILTTSLRHHFSKSPLPFITTSLRHHFPSSPLPFVTTSHRHHFPSSPLPFVTTQRHSFLFFCYVLLCHSVLFFCYVLFCYVLLCGLPPFIKVNCIASYSFVMYCSVTYCYVIYHLS